MSNITPIEGAVASENGAVEIANPDYMLPGQGSSNNFLRRISIENRDFIPLGENIVSITNDGDRQ